LNRDSNERRKKAWEFGQFMLTLNRKPMAISQIFLATFPRPGHFLKGKFWKASIFLWLALSQKERGKKSEAKKCPQNLSLSPLAKKTFLASFFRGNEAKK